MSPSATHSSRSGKSSKTTDRKTAHKTPTGSKKSAVAVRTPRATDKAVRPRKPAKTEVRPKGKPTIRETVSEAKKKRVTEIRKPKKTAKAAPPPKAPERLKRTPLKKATMVETPVAKTAPKPVSAAKPAATKARRGRKPAGEESPREKRVALRPFLTPPDEPKQDLDVVEEYLEESISLEEDEIIIPEEIDLELDPMEIPLALLDPELVDIPRPAPPPKPKPKLPKAERRTQNCAGCGQPSQWVSVEGLCFSCLKKKLSQRKRDDDGFTTYTHEPEEEDEG